MMKHKNESLNGYDHVKWLSSWSNSVSKSGNHQQTEMTNALVIEWELRSFKITKDLINTHRTILQLVLFKLKSLFPLSLPPFSLSLNNSSKESIKIIPQTKYETSRHEFSRVEKSVSHHTSQQSTCHFLIRNNYIFIITYTCIYIFNNLLLLIVYCYGSQIHRFQ